MALRKAAAYAILVCALLLLSFAAVRGGQEKSESERNQSGQNPPPQFFPISAKGQNAEGECSGDEFISCKMAEGGCTGKKYCVSGKFGECARELQVCQPGARLRCSLNSCSFGEAICNECGSGWGECLPREIAEGFANGSIGANNTNISCDVDNNSG